MTTNSETRGAVIFAVNTPHTDYLKMAEISAQRIRHFLDLPTSVITCASALAETRADIKHFDQVIEIEEPKTRNYVQRKIWHNKGRFQAYELSPYDDTILIDADYVVNSKKLLKLFELPSDILIHDTIKYLMTSYHFEKLGKSTFNTLWATLIKFKKTTRAYQLFEMLKQVQENYSYYSHVFHFVDYQFRNDYAATVALKTINGQLYQPEDFIPWDLIHIPDSVSIDAASNDVANTKFRAVFADAIQQRREYIQLRDLDFHLMNKKNFMELFDE